MATSVDDQPTGRRFDSGGLAEHLRATYEADLGRARTFLPPAVPLAELPPPFTQLLAACDELPERFPAEKGGVRRWLDRVFANATPGVANAIERLHDAERDRLMTALSVLGHTYRWDSVPPARERFRERRISLPSGIAVPWTQVARRADLPRVGTTWNLHLCNWALTDRPGGASYRPEELTPDRVRVAHNWLPAPIDAHLERFSVSFVLLEARGAEVLRHLVDAVGAAAQGAVESTYDALSRLDEAIRCMTLAFSRQVRSRTVDPLVWRELVQPTFAWSAEGEHPGLVEPGPNGMQVGTIQALDAALGVPGESAMAALGRSNRRYMPIPHRRFLAAADQAAPVIRGFVAQAGCHELLEQFNRCVRSLGGFRATHHARGAQYLRQRPRGDECRASTGLTIGVDDDPVATFDRSMEDRAAECMAAMLTPIAQPV